MDFFPLNGLGESGEHLTLQDMIECDMQTSFNEGLNTSGIMMRNSHTFQMENQSENLTNNILNTTDLDMSWIDSVDINQLQDPTENNNPNLLMVNPQTGLPVTIVQVASFAPASSSSSTVTLTNPMKPATPIQPKVLPNVITIPSTNLQTIGVSHANNIKTETQSPTITRSDTGVQVSGLQIATPISEFVNVVHALPISQHNRPSLQPVPMTSVTTPLTSPTVSTLPTYAETQQSPLRQHLQSTLQLGQQPVLTKITTNHKTDNRAIHQIVLTPSGQNICSSVVVEENQKVYPKPTYSYSCLIAMALKNSECGYLPVSEIYTFMTDNFPYFKTAPDGWKNSVRHNLSLNKCFAKVETPKLTQTNNSSRKVCLWGMNPAKIEKMEEEIVKWRKKDLAAIKRAMSNPDILHLLEKGQGPRSTSSSVTKDTTSNKLYNISSVQDHHLNTVNNNESEVTKQLERQLERPLATPASGLPSPRETANVINIKPLEPVKTEPDVDVEVVDPDDIRAVDSKHQILNISDKDLDVLNATLDPALNDFVIQSGIFDETLDRFEDIPVGTSPLSLSFSSFGNSNSPTSLATAATTSASATLTEVKSELSAALKARQAQTVQ